MNKKYWLRGGLIADAIFAISILVSYLSGEIKIENYTTQCLIAPCQDELHIFLHGNSEFLRVSEVTVLLIVLTVAFFILGSVIGWMYGKSVRSRVVPS